MLSALYPIWYNDDDKRLLSLTNTSNEDSRMRQKFTLQVSLFLPISVDDGSFEGKIRN